MMKVLHVIASPRGADSNTLRVSNALIEALHAHHENVSVEVVDLYHADLPKLAGANIEAKYTLMLGQPINKEHAESWAQIEKAIEKFLSADVYIISTPMWNLSIPYSLKYYIDCIVQPGYVFRYNELGQAVPLVHGKRMICVTSRGGDYRAGTAMAAYDFQEPYLRAIFGFIGITDVSFINSQPTDITSDLRELAISAGITQAGALASGRDWTPGVNDPEIAHPLGLKPRPLNFAGE